MKSYHYFYTKLFLLLLTVLVSISANAEVNWGLQIGGIPTKKPYGAAERFLGEEPPSYMSNRELGFDLFAGINLSISLTDKTPMALETGIRYRREYIYSKIYETLMESESYRHYSMSDWEEWGNLMEIPFKFTYYVSTSDCCGFLLGAGAYAKYNFTPAELYEKVLREEYPLKDKVEYHRNFDDNNFTFRDKITAGAELSAMFCAKAFTCGIQSQIPIYNGLHQTNNSWVNITIGIRFGSHVWSAIGESALAVTQALGTVATAYSDGYSAPYSNSNSSSESYNNYSGDSEKGSTYETQYYNWEKRARSAYESLSGHSHSGSGYIAKKKLLRDAQREMRNCRNKAKKEGITIPKSEYEDIEVKIL